MSLFDDHDRRQLRDGILDLLATAADPDHYLTEAQCSARGLPRRIAASVAAASRQVQTSDAATRAAQRIADEAVDHAERQSSDIEGLVARIPRMV